MEDELRAWVDDVVDAFAHLNYIAARQLLLNGLRPGLVASLPGFSKPADQARSDLIELVTRHACVAQVRVLLENAVQQTRDAHPKAHVVFQRALAELGHLAQSGTARAIIDINAWPAPVYKDLGLPLTPTRFKSPRGRWQMNAEPGDENWQRAFEGIRKGTHAMRAIGGPIEVFASTPYSLGAFLGLCLTDIPCTPRYWQASGPPNQQVWHRYGNARDRTLDDCPVLPPSLDEIRDGQPIAVHIGLSYPIDADEIPESDAALVELNAASPSYSAIPDARAAQRVAHEIAQLYSRLNTQARRSPVHVYYAGPGAVLMMASGPLRVMRDLTIHERLPTPDGKMRFVPAVRFQNGTAHLVEHM